MDIWTWQHFVDLADGVKLNLMMALIFANVATGIAVGIYTGQFLFKKVGDFLLKRLIPAVLGYAAVIAVGMADDAWKVFIPVVWAFIITMLTAAVLENLKELGLPIPDIPGLPKTADKPSVIKYGKDV